MRVPAGGAAANSTSATSAGPAVATPRSRQGGPAAVQVTSSRSVSPGSTGRRKRALATATRRRSSSAASRPPSCTRASHSMTPGKTGAPGKCPAKYGSLALTRFTPTARFPGSTSSTRSTRTYGNARRPLAPRSGWFVMGPLLLARRLSEQPWRLRRTIRGLQAACSLLPPAACLRHASSVVAALAALAPRLVRLAHHGYSDRLLELRFDPSLWGEALWSFTISSVTSTALSL